MNKRRRLNLGCVTSVCIISEMKTCRQHGSSQQTAWNCAKAIRKTDKSRRQNLKIGFNKVWLESTLKEGSKDTVLVENPWTIIQGFFYTL